MFQFEYVGGSRKPQEHNIEKFMMFFIVGGKEIPFFELKKLGYVSDVDDFVSVSSTNPPEAYIPYRQFSGRPVRHVSIEDLFGSQRNIDREGLRANRLHNYSSRYSCVKIFMAERGFGTQRRHASFFVELLNEKGNLVTIKPFSGSKSPFYFKAVCRFLKKDEVAQKVRGASIDFYKNQKLPVEILRQLITIDRSYLQENVRKIVVIDNKKKG